MAFIPPLIAAAGTALTASLPTLLPLAGGLAASMLMKPSTPDMPKPVKPPATPVQVSDTAAQERARIAVRARKKGGVGENILTPLSGMTGGDSSRTTLLGR